MMYREASKTIYNQIIEMEIVFIRDYKINPFELFGNLALLDMNSYIYRINEQMKEEHKHDPENKRLTQQLIFLRDTLNTMPLG